MLFKKNRPMRKYTEEKVERPPYPRHSPGPTLTEFGMLSSRLLFYFTICSFFDQLFRCCMEIVKRPQREHCLSCAPS